MTTKFTKEQLTACIRGTLKAAKDDESFSIAWFKSTENSPFAIIAGWQELDEDVSEVPDNSDKGKTIIRNMERK